MKHQLVRIHITMIALRQVIRPGFEVSLQDTLGDKSYKSYLNIFAYPDKWNQLFGEKVYNLWFSYNTQRNLLNIWLKFYVSIAVLQNDKSSLSTF